MSTVSHSTWFEPAGSRRGNSTRPERAILTKKPSADFSPISTHATDVGLPMSKNHWRSERSTLVIEVAVRVGAVEEAAGDVVDAQVEPGVRPAAPEPAARAVDGGVGELPVHEDLLRVDDHRGHAILAVAPRDVVRRRLFLRIGAEVELLRERRQAAPVDPSGGASSPVGSPSPARRSSVRRAIDRGRSGCGPRAASLFSLATPVRPSRRAYSISCSRVHLRSARARHCPRRPRADRVPARTRISDATSARLDVGLFGHGSQGAKAYSLSGFREAKKRRRRPKYLRDLSTLKSSP